MSFTIYPAIDIRGGKCVRLFQGDYEQETVYGESPLDVAKQWVEQGATWLHLVDLDGAKQGTPAHIDLICTIAREAGVPVQVGGGIRTQQDVSAYLDGGVSRVILGTAAIENRPFAEAVLARYGKQIAIGLDCRDGLVATRGWLTTTDVKAEQLAVELAQLGAETFIYTDISRDGTLTGPNIEAIRSLAQSSGKQVIASGGVSTVEDLRALARYTDEGVGGAIVGKALYTGAVKLAEALRLTGEGM
ncbi:1-(5-phosphoribosyl)-5-[(5-phosphoribosylamino)methylideneamino]imidazole-4-carboxamide isomerase [Brevibacillus humidisoli]|uniref:1-(5-phosphoribosyl)-5-[(5- phosphoribosylamino)methylideneamino]imidazole-4- carboxamide isomerase n=1 Tax=Brevibacillus humidisoli TaxID=2895522 RepID=UPI001E2C6966|nr:1-(5-phosphoribosyl)-5-[(5-phosphoribosylamino)methylideneamino]imidazole-4-carboxamide isomerase [Brevibacillus humidisoli]UFJ39987.1 1-(5-phosphoribosyl)-5-[(5-phosphoribosylamino)methylideneamino]imidazole-4-carboxamide isomerase [Brevibacillus humidisoli]